MKDYLQYQGNQAVYGSRDATRLGFNVGLVDDGDGWMDMIKERNRTSHTYNQATAEAIAGNIRDRFFGLFLTLQTKMQSLRDQDAE